MNTRITKRPLLHSLMVMTMLLFAAGTAAAGPAVAQSETGAAVQDDSRPPAQFYGRRICEIEVRGNDRSRDATVQRIADIETGTLLSEAAVAQARINLKKSGLFAEVDIKAAADADQVRLILAVEDKWTLIPAPFFSSDGDSLMGGLILIESNLLGTGKQLISGAMGGSDGLSGFAVFADPALLGSNWRLSLSANGGVGSEEIATPDGETALAFDSNSYGGSFGLGYRFSSRFEAGLRARVEQQELGNISGPAAAGFSASQLTDEIGEVQQQLGLQARYDATVPYGSLLQGFETAAHATYSLVQDSAAIDVQASHNLPTIAGQRLRLLAAGGYGERLVIGEEPVSGRDGFRTLPFGKATADDYWSVALAYDVPVLSQGWGAMVISSFYEQGWYRSSAVGQFDFYGPGAGFRVYLRKLAIPALGVDVAYNLQSGRTVFSVAVGMQM